MDELTFQRDAKLEDSSSW